MTSLYNVYLVVHSVQGMFEGLMTDAPVSLEEAQQTQAQYSDVILKADSVAMVAIGQGEKTRMVVPADVLRKSVLLFQIRPADAPFPNVVAEP